MNIQNVLPKTKFILVNCLCIKLKDDAAIKGYSAFYNTMFPPCVSYAPLNTEVVCEETR